VGRQPLEELIEAADLNGLLRAVDALCANREWDELVELAHSCEEALERGKQLWPIAVHIDYRLALEAPAEYAADAIDSPTARFALAPLTEVAAFGHRWDELAPHIESPQGAAYTAQERVLRGEDLEGDERAHAEVLELPLKLMDWEPTYALARFLKDAVEVAEPWDPKAPMSEVETTAYEEMEAPRMADALLELVTPWVNESNGAARVSVVSGDASAAASALVFDTLRMGALPTEEALQRMAWAAASGGAHGRRRGAAFGRFLSWYSVSTLSGLGWPPRPDDLRAGLESLRFFRFDEGEPEEGWVLRIAVEHPKGGWAAAIAATDLLDDPDTSSD
jgi:hypothetical protein